MHNSAIFSRGFSRKNADLKAFYVAWLLLIRVLPRKSAANRRGSPMNKPDHTQIRPVHPAVLVKRVGPGLPSNEFSNRNQYDRD